MTSRSPVRPPVPVGPGSPLRRPGPPAGDPTRPLDRSFYARSAETVARQLLGKTLVRADGPTLRRARIVETEAYVGRHDLACHASRGLTPRTKVMFGPPGHAYVYFIYGMHWLLNVVTSIDGDPQAVLLRTAEPLDGWRVRLDGPARLTRALGVDGEVNGADLCAAPLWLEEGVAVARVAVAPRVGVEYAGEWADAPLRFFDADSPLVSRRGRSTA